MIMVVDIVAIFAINIILVLIAYGITTISFINKLFPKVSKRYPPIIQMYP
jgi:hypothetical protein